MATMPTPVRLAAFFEAATRNLFLEFSPEFD
jgi:hypothetical protein